MYDAASDEALSPGICSDESLGDNKASRYLANGFEANGLIQTEK
jgi:hypothetical protein